MAAFSARFGNLRDFIRSRFCELEKGILDNLDLETAQILLSSHSLQIKYEDPLYDFVRSRSETDLRFASLLEFVCFEYLSASCIDNFVSFVSKNFLENISVGLRTRIYRRLILEANPNEKNPQRNDTGKEAVTSEPRRDFVYDSSKPLEGIIAHLTRECGGKVHDKGIVYIMGTGDGQDKRSILKTKASIGPFNYVFTRTRGSAMTSAVRDSNELLNQIV